MIPILSGENIPIQDIRPRATAFMKDVDDAVYAIVKDVRENGDEALFRYTARFEQATLSSLFASEDEIKSALLEIDSAFLRTMEEAASNIRAFHAKQKREGFIETRDDGVILGQRVLPLERVGLYVPGGTASYPSTVLMNAIPAKLAGVREIIMATPPSPDGRIAKERLAAAAIAGVDRVLKVGGAQAIAALAYGTKSVPAVDKITGPGNVYVAAAKRMVYGQCAIDMIAGPSEILIIADRSANPAFIAADMLAQAEHDTLAAAILLTDCPALAKRVQAALSLQLEALPRREVAAQSLQANGRLVVVPTLEDAVRISNAIAPEHLELCVEQPFVLLGRVAHAGSVFLGHYAPEALGDYFAGPNHTLPTNGTARFSSPLSVDDFVKKSSFIYYTKEALADACPHVARFAEQEGLQAHARSARIRFFEEAQV